MGKKITVESFDGTYVRIDEEKLEEFKARTEKIKRFLNEGKTKEEISKMLQEGKL